MGADISFKRQLGNRLKQVREQLGLTQRKVAESLGFKNYQSYLAIEKGEREVKAWELSKIARIFDVTVDYLLGGSVQVVESSEVLWRARGDAEGSKLIENRFLKFCSYYDLLERKTQSKTSGDFQPENNVGAVSFDYPNATELAERYWEKLSLGSRPALVLYDVLEKVLGIKIFQFSIGLSGSGASTFGPFGPAILVNSDKVPWRRNFDLAHELFHILTWHLFDRAEIHCGYDDDEKSIYEKWADSFASTLLLPREYFLQELKTGVTGSGTIMDYIELSRYFGVSLDAFLWRLVDFRILEREQVRDVLDRPDVKEMNREARKGDRQLAEKFSNRYAFLAIRCLQRGLISRSKFAEICDIHLHEVPEFLGRYGFSEEELDSIDFALT